MEYIQSVCDEFRLLYQNIKGTTPYCVKTVAVLNAWGKCRSWGCHMVHHALYQKQNYSYAGVIEALSGAPFDVKFISFEDIKADPSILDGIDVIINVGDGDTAHTGGLYWEDETIASAIKGFVHRGGGIIGVGEPAGHQYQGRYLQLAGVMGVEKETGFTLNYDKYNWDEHPDHFILADTTKPVDFGEGKKNIYALESAEILVQREREVQMAVNEFGEGRSVYISGLPYSFENSRILYRSILWASHSEDDLHKWVQLQLQRGSARLCEERQVLRGQQHLRAAAHHRLQGRRLQLRSGHGSQRDPLVRDLIARKPTWRFQNGQ